MVSSYADSGSRGNPKIKRLVSKLYERRTAMDAQRRLSGYGTEVTEYVLPVLNDNSNESVRVAALRIIASVNDSTNVRKKAGEAMAEVNSRI